MQPTTAVVSEPSTREEPRGPETAAAARALSTRPHGFRPTLRHQVILVGYFALLFTVLRPMVERTGAWGPFNATIAGVLVSPWLLAVLVLVFDRAGPLKHWLAPVLLAAFGPAIALSCDVTALVEWSVDRTLPHFGRLAVVNVLFVAPFVYYVWQVGPRRCPSCARRGLIPVYYLWGTAPRMRRTRWCAACGVSYWRRSPSEPWAPERRAI